MSKSWGTSRIRTLAKAGLGLSLALVGLTALAAPPASAADPCGPTGNKIACENSKPGTPQSEWDITGAGDDDIQGFATDISVNVGSKVDFKIDTDATAYTVDIYRTGWYGGDGARKIASVTPSASLPQHQPACITDEQTDLYDCGNWSVSASWTVPSTAVSGVYFANLTRTDNGHSSHITFVVRDDSSTSDLFFKTSDATWQAYNGYGGASFYWGGSLGRALKLSYNRPVATRSWQEGRDFYMSSEYAMVRFLERNGYDISYTTDVDSARRGELIKNHKTFLSVGHDEYWSGAERSNVEAARAAGVNLLFASGNEVYWRTRFEPSADPSHTDYRTLVCYKETWSNTKLDPASEWTGTWRDPRFAAPSTGAGNVENALTGTAYRSNFTDLPVTVSATEGKQRFWRNTSLASLPAGTTQALAAHTVGYESDEDLDNGFRPQGLIRLSSTVGSSPEILRDFGNTVTPGTTEHHTTLYKAASGALVWSAGSVQWAWGLDQTHDGAGAAPDSRMQQAQVNILADMGAQPTTLMAGLTSATKSSDATGPTATVTSPGAGNVANGMSVTATGTASDTGGVVAGVEVSTDGETWHPAQGTTSWSYTYVQRGQGPTPLRVRAIDDSANVGAITSVSRTVTCPCSVYGSETPPIVDSADTGAVELGLRFTPTSDGFVSGVRFYKSAANTGTHVGSLWSSAGQRLATVTFSGETASGWQSASFSSPVAVTAGDTYVVSYTAPNGRYSLEDGAFWYRGEDNGALSVAGGWGSEPAGVFSNPGAFPNNSFQRAQYYVDVLFTTVDESPLALTNRWPLPGSSSVPAGTTVSGKFNKPIQESTLAVTVKDQLNQNVSGTTSYDAATRTFTFTPAAALSGFVTYSVQVTAKDTLGQDLGATGAWSFRTAKPAPTPGVCPCGLFDESVTPEVLQANDADPVTLGVRFTPTVHGVVTGVSFYKGPNNQGTHVGSLWRADGTKLAEATFTGESTSGWQTVTFTTPVSVTKNTEYVAAYRAPQGNYSLTPGALASSLNRDPLVSSANGGAYTYGTGFPDQRSSSSYLVDVVFDRQPDAIAVAGQDPAPGAVGVGRQKAVQVWFTQPIRAGASLSAKVGGQAVAGTTSLSPDATTLTFSPSSILPANATVDVTLTGVVSDEGAVLPTQAWSFTTGSATTAPETLFGGQVPTVSSNDDGSAVELGTAFSPSRDGKVTGIRFFKGAGNAGTHTGSLWSESGTRLATVTFTGETPSGWQTADLATPVQLQADETYVVSYYAPQGHYASTAGFFSSPWTSGPLTAPAADNGRYLYATGGGFPTFSFNATNYFVDVVFVPDDATISVVSTSPQDGAQNVSSQAEVTVQLSAAIADGYSLTLTSGGSPVPGSTTLSPDRKTLTFSPSGALPGDATVSVSLTGVVSQLGAALGPKAWSFTTAASTATLFGNEQPANASVNDSDAIELGTAFTPSVGGTVTGVRFYKGTGNTGIHTGSLWSAGGERLATVSFGGETASGWQSATFASPVSVTAGTPYVVSYYAPNGHYSATSGYFSQAKVSGPLTAPAVGNGRYRYGTGGGFPSSSWASTNYYVDVVFRTG
jgi:hypothetical protein